MALPSLHTPALNAASCRLVVCGFALPLLLIAPPASAQVSSSTSASASATSSVPGFVHHVWTTKQGLPQNIVRRLTQTRDGYLWLGTSNGLVRFDGVTFTVFELTNTPALGSNWISALFEDRDGTLWIGTDAGLVRYRDGAFTSERLHKIGSDDAVDDEIDRVVVGVQQDRQGHLWAATRRQVLRRIGTRWRPLAIGARHVTCVLLDRHDSVWIGTTNGLMQWNGEPLRTLAIGDGLPDNEITALHEDREGQLWIGTTRGLARFDPDSGIVTREAAAIDVRIGSVYEDRGGRLWIGSTSMLAMRTREGQLTTHPIADRAAGEQVVALTEDREGQLWFGVEGGRAGLHSLTPRRVTVLAHAQGLACDSVVPITESADGTVWAGLSCPDGGQMIAIRDLRAQTITRTDATARAPTRVASILALPEGGAWVGTFSGELFQFDDGRFTRHLAPARELGGDAIVALHRDAHGALWLGTNRGLVRYDGGRITAFRTREGLVHDDVRSLAPDGDGALWIGTAAGVSRYHEGRFTNYTVADGVPPGPVRALHIDRHAAGDSIVWAGSYGGGLARFKHRRWFRYGTQGGLLDTSVHRILDDDRGHLWMSGDRGIRRVGRRELDEIADGSTQARLRVRMFDEHDGMLTAECNGMGQPAGWKMRDGTLWFPTQGGIVRIDPASVERSDAAPPPVIETLAIDGGAATPAAAMTMGQAGASDLQITYAAPTFVRADHVQFRYRLHGYDTDWIDAGGRRMAHYANLAPGEYRFEVLARSSAGPWSDRAASIIVTLPPLFSQRPVVRGLLALSVLALAVAAVTSRIGRLRRRTRALEATLAERTSELRVERERLDAANAALLGAKADLEAAHTQLLSMLQQLRIGIVIVDARQRVLFVSQAVSPLLGRADDDVVGRPLGYVLPVSPSALADLQILLKSRVGGSRLRVELCPAAGPRSCAEIEVRMDPREEGNRILYLHDVAQVPEPARFPAPEPARTGLEWTMAEPLAAQDAERVVEPIADRIVDPIAALMGASAGMRLVHQQVRALAAVETTVLIEGETGTGKELVARAIHGVGRRKDQPFVTITCAGMTESRLASQLFGHRRGAFTGAVADHMGLFEAAHGGTLLLDEIGDMPIGVQTQLLRALEAREIVRIGDSRPRPVDVRVLVTTHRSLDRALAEGKFREDLLVCLRVGRVAVPALRQRAEDIPLLASVFLRELCGVHGKALEGIAGEAMERLAAHRWPGNVRELKATIEWAVIHAAGPTIRLTDLPPETFAAAPPCPAAPHARAVESWA